MSTELSTKKRYRLIEECFGEVLRPHGFSTQDSKKAVFWRRTEGGLYQYIAAWRSMRRPKYDIMVFAFHPTFDENFESKHPDDIGCPIHGSLHSKRGVGLSSEQLFCKTEEGFRRDFAKRGEAMLRDHAIPFLDNLQAIEDLIPLIMAPGLKNQLNKAIK